MTGPASTPRCRGRPPRAPARLRLFGIPLALICLGLAAAGPGRTASGAEPAVIVLDIKGAIGVATSGFIERGIERAHEREAHAVVLRIDTPGGLLNATRDITGAILGAPVPIVAYVAPSGARAASAGTFIVYASHVAAMAPGTHIGAATPVSLGGPPGMPGRDRPPADERKPDAPEPANAGERKAVNDAAAYLRSLAQLRGRNAEFAEAAVRDAATMTADEARGANVVDVLAPSLEELLAAIDGRAVVVGGTQRTLATKGVAIEVMEPGWRSRAIAIITDPNVAYLLMIIGFYGIIFEIWNPGFLFPGVLGAICLLLALAALAVLPVNYAGLGLIALGIALMIAEAFTPGFLVLGIGGIIAFVVGSIFLFDPADIPAEFTFGVAWPLVAAATASTAGFILLVLGFALKARRRPVVTGLEQMIGDTARVVAWSGDRGRVHVHGEDWQARLHPGGPSPAPLTAGSRVRIVALEGLTAIVEPIAAETRPSTER